MREGSPAAQSQQILSNVFYTAASFKIHFAGFAMFSPCIKLENLYNYYFEIQLGVR